jgi:hypothetical protein
MSEQEPKTLGDTVKIAREKWSADHGGRDTIQELVHQLQRQAEEDRAAIRRLAEIVRDLFPEALVLTDCAIARAEGKGRVARKR